MDLFWSEFIRFGSGDKFRIVDDDDSWIRDFEGQGRVTSINDNELVLDIVIPKQDIPTRGLLRNIVENRLGSSILPIPKIEAVLKIILIKEEGGNLLEVKGKYTIGDYQLSDTTGEISLHFSNEKLLKFKPCSIIQRLKDNVISLDVEPKKVKHSSVKYQITHKR